VANHSEYNEAFVAGLEHMWGEGFLSPGGKQEVSKILEDVSLLNAHVLDIGCGLGAIDMLLLEEHQAKSVVGIDIEPELIVPFSDNEFDAVFSKDSIVHIEDKSECYREIARVLKPGGVLAFSDWYGSADSITDDMTHWLEVVNLTFSLGTIDDAVDRLRDVGLVAVRQQDRNQWYLNYMAQELGSISGENFTRLARKLGERAAKQRVVSSTLKHTVVAQGQLRPGHVQAINRKQDSI